ncbi:Disintegrin and metalloproteinase domain-containing protein 10 [Parelaphostrongylus tenuis]|uniref:Disintegrin and metalloproteinase domain-containing protein 10 n=1 Tax=Parelaphostrongylus tenuis TaxID=148309 RepID=A0AAD5MCL7_PARTN|nr:Disintegrin and metalloproteinase domain-containing protein 10 [Parelaphostrongylus tenuis]
MRFKRSSPFESDDGLNGCGLSDRIKREMERIQRSAEVPTEVYTNFMTMQGRSKRATRDDKGIYSVRTCSLYLQADHKLYAHIKRKEGNNDPIRTREEIVSLFYNHIKAVNEIYEGTNFNGIKGFILSYKEHRSIHRRHAIVDAQLRVATILFAKKMLMCPIS